MASDPPPIQANIRRSKRRSPPSTAENMGSTVGSLPQPQKSPEIDDFDAAEVKSKRKRQPVRKRKKSAVEESRTVNGDGYDEMENEEEGEQMVSVRASLKQRKGVAADRVLNKNVDDGKEDDCFVGDPVPEIEAKQRWPHRYLDKNDKEQASIQKCNEQTDLMKARRHYLQAKVDGIIYNINDDAYVKAGEGELDYIGRIVEFFEASDHELYFTAQWFFRAQDTVIKEHAHCHDDRRVFLSDETNDNALNCIVKKIRIIHVALEIDCPLKDKDISDCDLYYDMSFSVGYSSFACLPSEAAPDGIKATSPALSCGSSNVSDDMSTNKISKENDLFKETSVLSLLDVFSGCGAMSAGLCLGANLSGVSLQTRWAVDMNRYACDSLKHNHPETEVRNEKAEDFLSVLREWKSLCEEYGLGNGSSHSPQLDGMDDDEETEELPKLRSGEFEVGKIVGICYGKTDNLDKVGLKFKVRWKGYGPDEDTWEPVDGLSNCQERIREFVRHGYVKNILPLPGSVDVICGGPPCQGISGFNRFRQKDDPLKDEKNKQMLVFMEIVEFLKPKFILMENVVDILKFSKGFLGRYALNRLIAMKYQARLGILAAGNYGLPQYRMRVFLWGAHPTQRLPQFPLPTHDVVTRGSSPVEFETHVVAYDGSQQQKLENALLLADAISDLPSVRNDETRDEISYEGSPNTDFQRYNRFTKDEMMLRCPFGEKHSQNDKIFDHRPLQLNVDDFQRVCRVPKQKGANFRNFPGVMVVPGNIAQWDPNIPRVLLPSGKPLVPDYAMSYINGKSLKPFGRLWWDETVPTVVTRAEPHNQIIVHPEQDRVLTVRENARLQGFPDYYKLFGPIKERYTQVGNAVAVPVSRALGYGLGLAYLEKGSDEPVFVLPQNFPINICPASSLEQGKSV